MSSTRILVNMLLTELIFENLIHGGGGRSRRSLFPTNLRCHKSCDKVVNLLASVP